MLCLQLGCIHKLVASTVTECFLLIVLPRGNHGMQCYLERAASIPEKVCQCKQVSSAARMLEKLKGIPQLGCGKLSPRFSMISWKSHKSNCQFVEEPERIKMFFLSNASSHIFF